MRYFVLHSNGVTYWGGACIHRNLIPLTAPKLHRLYRKNAINIETGLLLSGSSQPHLKRLFMALRCSIYAQYFGSSEVFIVQGGLGSTSKVSLAPIGPLSTCISSMSRKSRYFNIFVETRGLHCSHIQENNYLDLSSYHFCLHFSCYCFLTLTLCSTVVPQPL